MLNLKGFRNLFKVLVVVVLSLLFMTCDPGLGKAVDTQAPKLEVQFPVTKSVLKGAFTMKGIASDEVKVASCVVTFKNIKTSQEYSFNASVEKDEFTFLFNTPKEDGTFELPDGDYNVTVKVSDAYRNSTADVVYTIDNTAPTVLLTSPNAYMLSNWPDMYKLFTIKGEVYDATTITEVKVFITDEQGNILVEKVADGTNTFLATFEAPAIPSGKTCYYYAVAKDSGGNVNTYCYHKADIFELISSQKSATSFPNINSIGYVDQGVESTFNEIITQKLLNTKKLQNQKSGLQKGSYPGFDYYDKETAQIKWLNISEDTLSGIAIGSPVLGTIMPPTNGSAISLDKVEVYLVKSTGDKEFPEFPTSNFDTWADGITKWKIEAGKVITDEEGNVTEEKQAKLTQVGDSVNFQVDSHPVGVLDNWPSATYKIKIKFVTNSQMEGSRECAFSVTSGAPKLTEGEFSTDPYASYFRGFMTHKTLLEGKNKLGGVSKTSDGSGSVPLKYEFTGTSTGLGDAVVDSEGNYSIAVDIADDGSKDGEYTYTLTAETGVLSTVISRVVVIDTTAPEISFNNLSEGDILSSSDFNVTGTVTDANGISKVEYQLLADGTSISDWVDVPGSKTSLNLPLTNLKENITYTLKLRATDAAIPTNGTGNISGDDAYKCNFTIDLANPVATIDKPEPEDGSSIYFTNIREQFTGKASDNAQTVGKLAKTAVLSFSKDGVFVGNIEAGTGEGQFNWDKTQGTWSWTPTSSQFDGTGKYDVKLVVTDDAGKTTEDSLTVSLDETVPNIRLTQVSPFVERQDVTDGQAKYYVNGTIAVKFDVTENDYIKNIKWYKPDGSEDTTLSLGTNAQPTVNIDTTKYADGTKLGEFKIEVEDRSGNIGEYTTGDLLNYEINQTSDLPLIMIAGIDDSVTSENGITAEKNLFSSSESLSLNCEDDDGIKEISYQIDGASAIKVSGGDLKVKTVSIPLQEKSQGAHTIKVTVTDIYGKSVSSNTIYFGIDDNAPNLTIDGYSATDIDAGFKNTNFDITGSVSDSYELRGLDYDDNIDFSGEINPNGDGTWTLSITKPDASKKRTIKFVATDKFLRTTVKTFTYIFDLDKPNLNASEDISGTYFNQNTVVTLTGTANDLVGDASTQSGLKLVQYGLGDGHNAGTVNSDGWKNANGSAEWTVLLNIPGYSDGAYTLFVKAVDNSGNESEVQKFNITADSTSPVLTEGGSSDASGTSYASGTLSLTGTVTELNLKNLTYTYTLDGEVKETSDVVITSSNGAKTDWSVTKDNLGDGTHVFKIVATDMAGNQSAITRNIIIDKTPPSITTNVSPQIMYNNGNGEELTVNGTIDVNVRVVETNKLKGVYYTFDDWSTQKSFTELELAAGKTISVDTTQYADKSKLPLKIKAIDEANNEALAEVNPVVNQESDKPTFKPSNFNELAKESSAGWIDGSPINVFGETTPNMIFILSDDDSVKEYWVKLDAGDFVKVSDVNSTQQIVTYSVKELSYGRHTITFRVKDSNCKDDLSTTNNYVEKTYYIAIDDKAPDFTLNNANGQYVGSSFAITGNVEDANGVKQIVFKPKSGGEQVYHTIDYDGTEQTKSFSYTFTVPLTKDTILITAYDSIGNATIKELTYLVDTSDPTVLITNGTDAFVDGDSPSLRITGNAVDGDLDTNDNGISGIDQVLLKIGSSITGKDDVGSFSAKGTIVDDVMSWSYNLDFTDYTAGSYNVYAKAFDIAGNESVEETITVYVDTDVPTLTNSYTDNYIGIKNSAFTIEGTATDASGVKSVTAKIQGASGNLDPTSTFVPTQDSTPASWSFNIPANIGDGQLTILVTAKDGCGKTVQETFTATLDTVVPTVTFTDISDDDKNNATIETSKTTTTPRVSVSYADVTSGVNSVAYTFYYYDPEGNITGKTPDENGFVNYSEYEGNATGSFTRDKSFSGTVVMRMAENTGSKGAFIFQDSETDGKWYVKVTVTDEAGNSETYDSPYFYVDQHKPELEVTKPADGTLKKQNDSLTVSGTTSDSLGGQIDKVVVKVTHPNYDASKLDQFTKTFTKDGSNGTNLLTQISGENYSFEYTWDAVNSPFIYFNEYEVSIFTYDVAGNETSVKKKVYCDNEAPSISFTRPYSYSVDSYGSVTVGTVVNSPIGDTSIKAVANDPNMSSIYYQVGGTVEVESTGTLGQDDYKITKLTITDGGVGSDTYGTSVTDVKFDDVTVSLAGTWNKVSDANLNFDVSYNTLTFNNNEKTYHVAGDEETIMTLDVHFVAVDSAGNINYCKMPVKVDTDTDKPNLLVLSPKTVGDVANVGGTATVSGTVNDDNSVHSVLMQVELVTGNYVDNILTGNSGSFGIDYSDISKYNMSNPQVLVENVAGDKTTYSLKYNTTYFADRTKWYRVNLGAENSTSTTWNMVLNKFKEFDNDSLNKNGFLTTEIAQTELIVRVRALDTKSGDTTISDDAKLGDVAEFRLVIDAGSPSIIINNIEDFPTEGSYIGGTLNFDIEFTDDESITEWAIEALSTANGDNRSMTIASGKYTGTYEAGLGQSIPKKVSVNTEDIYDACGNLIQIKISAKDNSKDSQSEQEAAKESYITFKYTIDNSAPEANHVDGTYRVTTETVNGNELRETEIRGSHLRIMSDQAAFKGKVLDEANGSGVDYVMLYFTKDGNLYNPSQKNVSTSLSYQLNLRDENGGGINVDFPVESLNDVARTPSANGGNVTPYIVVDRAEGMLDTGANGDLDGYDENLKANGDWVVYIESSNLPDGVYDIHYVVVDFAKNARYYHDTMLVQNNAPTINSIVLATDIDGDGVASIGSDDKGDEYQKFNFGSFDETGFTVRNSKLKLKVNVTGGTGTLKYYLRYQTTDGVVTTDENNSGYTTGEFEVTSFLGDSETPVDYVVWVEDTVEQNLSLSSGENTIDMIMDNVDDVHPVAQFFELNTEVESSASAYENRGSLYKANGSVKGHIEPREYSRVDNDDKSDPDISGTIILRGEVMDNQRIGSISLTLGNKTRQVALWNGTSLEVVNEDGENRATLIKNELGLSGHYVEWSYVWDTWDITNNVCYDTPVKVLATDYTGNSIVEKEFSAENNIPRTESNKFDKDKTPWGYNYITVDVVPYITKIETPNRIKSGLKNSNIRSASGKYSVIKGTTSDFIKVYGFNLNANAVRIVDSTEVTSSVSASTGNSLSYQTPSSPYNEVSLSNNSSISGYLEVIVNGIRSINNINDNDQSYNQESDESIKNTLLNDDRYLRFFDMKDTGVKNGYYPNMLMNGDNPVFGYVDLSGGPSSAVGTAAGTGAGTYYASCAMPQRAEFNYDDASEVYTEYLIKASLWDQMGMAKDEAGRYYHASLYNRDGCQFSFIYDRFAELHTSQGLGWGSTIAFSGFGDYSGYAYDSQTKNNAIGLESCNYGDSLLLGRYQYPKIIARGNSVTSKANIYMSYFDAATGELIFRDFQIGTSVTGTSTQLYSGGSDQQGRPYSQYYNFTEAGYGSGDDYSTGRITAATKASKYFDFGVTNYGRVAIVYYDESLGRLVLKYSNSIVDCSSPTADVAFVTSSIVFPDYVGAYVSMYLEPSTGEIHIAAFDSGDSDRVYIYIDAFDSTTYKMVRVDQASAVGNWTQIKVKGNVPYIAYYNATEAGGKESIKLAYANSAINSIGTVVAGVNDEGYTTGNWEYMTVPAITAPQGGSEKFQRVCLDFNSAGKPVVGYLGSNLEFGTWCDE